MSESKEVFVRVSEEILINVSGGLTEVLIIQPPRCLQSTVMDERVIAALPRIVKAYVDYFGDWVRTFRRDERVTKAFKEQREMLEKLVGALEEALPALEEAARLAAKIAKLTK